MSDMTREEAIEEIKRWTPILLTSGQCTEKTSKAQDMAISALSTDVRPNIHAEWEKPTGKIQPFGEDTRQCTGCGFFTDKDGCYVYNFCPNCGADMRGK